MISALNGPNRRKAVTERAMKTLPTLAFALVVAAPAAVPAAPAWAASGGDPRCTQYGRGFVFSESTGFCIRLSGSVESSYRVGKGPFHDHEGGSIANGFESEANGALDARKETELGPMRLFVAPKGRVGSKPSPFD